MTDPCLRNETPFLKLILIGQAILNSKPNNESMSRNSHRVPHQLIPKNIRLSSSERIPSRRDREHTSNPRNPTN